MTYWRTQYIVCSVDEEWGSGLAGEVEDGQKGSAFLDNPGGQREVELDDGSPILSAVSFAMLSAILDACAIYEVFFFLHVKSRIRILVSPQGMVGKTAQLGRKKNI
jgi:hypothetical protein